MKVAVISNDNCRGRGARLLGVSLGLSLVGILAAMFPTYPSEPRQPADRSARSVSSPVVRNYLGVWMENTNVFFPGVGSVQAVRIFAVDPGSPAQAAGLVSGDIVVWADGRHVRRFEHLADSVARSRGTLSLSIVQANTGRYMTLPPIKLAVVHAQAPQAPAYGAPAASGIEGESGGAAKQYEKKIDYPSPTSPATKATGNGADTKKDDGPRAVKNGHPPSREVPRSADVTIRDFPWPPPKASSWTRLPAELLHRAQAHESLLDVSRRLEAAFRKAGYVEWSYYAVPKGFAIVTQLEQYQNDGAPLKEPDRWSVTVPAPEVFSLASYLKALFSASPGHFRIVVLVVTPEPVSQDDTKKVTRTEAIKWVGAGVNKLPKEYDKMPFDADVDCTALIYEFDQPSRDSKPRFEDPGLLNATIHLKKSRLLEALGQ